MDVNLNFINELIYVNEWGGTSRRFFSKKHDNILFYANGEDYKFYPERIQIPKVTAGTAFDKKGTGLKTPCDVFYDHASFSTMSGERIKFGEHNIQWQKPLWLMDRLLLSTTDEGDTVLDPFMGSGTTAVWCKKNNRNFIGIENNKEVFEIAKERINGTE
jgi:DNA modification methylase